MEFILDKFLKSNGPSATIGSSPLKAESPFPIRASIHSMPSSKGTTPISP
jgi:hypothetical protein